MDALERFLASPSLSEATRRAYRCSTITVEGTVRKLGKDNKLVRIVATKFYPG